MKKYFSNIRTLAALLMAGAAFTACSSDDNISEQPANPAGEKVYTLTVNATKDAGATTRALEFSGEKLVAKWATSDEIYVIKLPSPLGTLTPTNISADGNSATFTGTFTPSDLNVGDNLILSYHYHGISDFAKQNGMLNGNAVYSAEAYDQAEATVTVASIDDSGNITTTADASFTTQTAMIKFTLQDNATTPNKINATSLNVKATITLPAPLSTITEDLFTFTIAPEAYTYNGNGILYYALPSAATLAGPIATKLQADPYNLTTITESDVVTLLESAKVTFTASDGVNTYTVDKTGYPFAAGRYYTSTLTMAKRAAPASVATDLSTISETYTASDGETLTGTLTNNVKISIADGATVTLKDVTINGTNDSNYEWAGITCLGDATIILSGTNTVKGFYDEYPGIYVPEGNTVTINGSGSLTASSNGWGAGIGGGWEIACGNIEIQGGTITATGGKGAAGIGSGGGGDNVASCGTITISGGTVTATGGEAAAGIGTGEMATCGSIRITGGTVTAQGGDNAAGIGCGQGSFSRKSECGAITIEDGGNFTSVTAIRGQCALRPIGHSSSDNNTCGTITFGYNTVYTAESDPSNYSTDDGGGLNFEQTMTDLGGDENYTDNTWKLWR